MLTELQKRKLMKLFCMYDANNFGVLKLTDFEKIAQQLAELRGWSPDSPQYYDNLQKYLLLQWNRIHSEIRQKLNSQNSGKVSLEDWFTYYDIVLNDSQFESELMLLPEAVFHVVDADQSGKLDKNEWTQLFRVYNVPVIYVDETFLRIDVDGDGVLSKDEVIPMIRDFFYSSDPEKPRNYMFGPI